MVKKTINDAERKGVSVKQFADEIGVKDTDKLLRQFKEAGINIASANDFVSEDEKQKLLRYLQQHHGGKQKQDTAPERIVLRRAKTSEIKLGGSHGGVKTVSIQVRKKRTYVKRTTVEDEGKTKLEEVSALPNSGDESTVPVTASLPSAEIIEMTPSQETPAPAPVVETTLKAVEVTYAEEQPQTPA